MNGLFESPVTVHSRSKSFSSERSSREERSPYQRYVITHLVADGTLCSTIRRFIGPFLQVAHDLLISGFDRVRHGLNHNCWK